MTPSMTPRKSVFRPLALATLAALALSDVSEARAQFSYTFYPNNTTVNTEITTDFVIAGYTSGSYNDDFMLNFAGPSSPTVNIVDGALIDNELDSFNDSIINVNGGGAVSGLVPMNNSTVNMNAGFAAYAISSDHSTINMTGGYISDLEGQGAVINVSGGQVDTLVANTQSSFYGDDYGSGLVNVTGGQIGGMQAFNKGILNVRGGTLNADILAAYGGTINIYGTGLNALLVDPNYLLNGASFYHYYTLSGALEDGTTLSNTPVYIRNDSVNDGPGFSSLHLLSGAAAPEPGAASLLLLGGAGPAVRWWVRRKKGS